MRPAPAPSAPSSLNVVSGARTSPTGKFSDEVEPSFVGSGPMAKKPFRVWPTTVRLPVTAIASDGMPD